MGSLTANLITENPSDQTSEIDLRQWTSITPWTSGSTGTDIGPIIDQVADYFNESQPLKKGTIRIGGACRIATPPTSSKIAGCKILGYGETPTQITYDNDTGFCFTFDGSNGETCGGIGDMAILLQAGVGTSSAGAIYMGGNTLHQPDQFRMKNLYITSLGATDYWYDIIKCDGTQRTSPQGIRGAIIENVQLFRGSHSAFTALAMIQWSINNLGSYVGMGTGMDIIFSGGGSSLTNSSQVDARNIACNGNLYLNNITKLRIDGSCNELFTDSSCDYVAGTIERASQSGSFGSHNFVNVF